MSTNSSQDNFEYLKLSDDQAIRLLLLGDSKKFSNFWTGATIMALVTVLTLGIYLGSIMRSGLGFIVDIILVILCITVVTALTGLCLACLLKILKKTPTVAFGVSLAAAIVTAALLKMFFAFPLGLAILSGTGIVCLQALLGSSLQYMQKPGKMFWRTIACLVLLATIGINVYLIMWAILPGTNSHLVAETISLPPGSAPFATANPAEKGGFKVLTLAYGSGQDKHRPEFDREVDLTSTSVDATPFITLQGFKNVVRKWYWGFGLNELPLNGRVWYPEGDGPFPLVLIVHGNHQMEKSSDTGYTYLGELLASKGFITVSVDENFLNSNWAGSIGAENQVRAWLLLQHLEQWQTWNWTADGPFFKKVDLSNIALIGHSRGGEAVAIAAAFNKLPYYPDNANIKFDFNFAIKSVIAIAPSDGQYKPMNQPLPLENVNYFVLQGGHDSDISYFMGEKQYQRVKFTDGNMWFKSSLYVYQANHGEFNTVWGQKDLPGIWGWLLNTKPLLSGDDQRQIAKVYVSAFLLATIQNKSEYLPMFRDHRLAFPWLPKTVYVNQYADANLKILCSFEEDIDPASITAAGGYARGDKFALWREQALSFRTQLTNQANNGVYLSWVNEEAVLERESKKPYYTVVLPDYLAKDWLINPTSALVFSLANLSESKDQDLTIELTTTNGESVRLPLSYFSPIHPVLKVKFLKWNLLERKKYGAEVEPILQTYELPFSHFMKTNPKFNPAKLKSVKFIFDLSKEGAVIIDDIGFQIRNITFGYHYAYTS